MDVLTTILYPGAFFVKRNHIVKFLDSRVEILVKKNLGKSRYGKFLHNSLRLS